MTRPPEDFAAPLRDLYALGCSISQLAILLPFPRWWIQRWLRRCGFRLRAGPREFERRPTREGIQRILREHGLTFEDLGGVPEFPAWRLADVTMPPPGRGLGV